MVKQKKSTPVYEKERKVDEEPKGEDRLQRSNVVKDGLPVDNTNNTTVLPVVASAESFAVGTKRTRSRPQPNLASKDPKATAENDTPVAEVELQPSDGAQCQPPMAVHQIATRSTTGRLAKRPKQEIPSKKLPPKKQAKEVQQVVAEGGNVEPARSRRPWELWGTDDTNLFFEALFEHGKDFDAIQTFMAQRHKKRGGTESAAKTKDQIRHFYYRTSHKISNHLKLSSATDDVRKQALELYGLVCYGEIRRKSLLKVNKIWSRMNELLTQGSTMIRVRGKNLRIKVPQCRALKRLCNVEEQRDDSKLKLPEKVTLKLHPRTNAAWSHVQMLSQNPRLILNVQPDQHLSAVFDYLSRKWRLACLQMKEALGEKVVDPLELRLCVSSDYTLTPLSISRSNSQPKLDFSFVNFLENMKNSLPALSTSVSPPNKRTLKVVASRTDDQPSKNPPVTETVKTSTNSSTTNEEDQLRISPRPVQPSLTNSLVSLGTRISDNSIVSIDTDDNACDVSTATVFYPGSGNRPETPGVGPDTSAADMLTHLTAERKDSDALDSLNPPSSVAATSTVATTSAIAATAPAMLSTSSTTLSACATSSGVATLSVAATSSVADTTSSLAVKTFVTTTSSSAATTPSSDATATTSAATMCSSAAAVQTCNSLLVDRLSGPIDRTLAEEVTIAELFIMAGRPKELILEYDWIRKCWSSGSVAEQSVSIGSALQHLTNIALNEFAGFSRTANVGRLGAMSPPSTALGFKMDANSIGAKGPTRSPRVRQNPSVSRTRKDSISKAPDASLDQSANYPWSNASTLVTSFDATNLLSAVSLPSLYTFSTPGSAGLSTISTPVTMVTYSNTAAGDGNSPKTLMTPTSEGVFRVPKSLPPKLQAKNTDGRTIVDKKILDGLGIYHSKRSELFMPRKARARNSRKPLVIQRTLLPKSQLQTSQIVTLTLVPGVSSAQTGSFLPVACTATLSSLQLAPASTSPETMKLTTAVSSNQQNVIKMAPTELKSTGIRRIIPVPVPADTVAVFPAVDKLVGSSQSDVVMTTVPNVVDQSLAPSSLISESSLPTAITGIDAFLESSESQDAISMQQGSTRSLAPTLAPSFIQSLGDSNLSIPSLLDMSLQEGADSTDRFLDLDLMNSNSSFPGFLNTVEEKNSSASLTLTNDDSLLNSVKHLPSVASNETAWFNNEESLSNLLPNFSSVKKDLDKSLTMPATVSVMTTSSMMHSNVFISENSRESSMLNCLNNMEVNFQSAMDEENTFEIGSNFKQVVEQQSSEPYHQLRTITSESSSHSYIHSI